LEPPVIMAVRPSNVIFMYCPSEAVM